MTRRMLIDASHAEETRVAVLDDNRLEEFDVETQTRKQLKGNIYLAKVVRVEPGLQAAFVEYGGNRHGFLAFGEIHPDYYQIPVADRQRLLAMQEAAARDEEDEEDDAAPPPAAQPLARAPQRRRGRPPASSRAPDTGNDPAGLELTSDDSLLADGHIQDGHIQDGHTPEGHTPEGQAEPARPTAELAASADDESSTGAPDPQPASLLPDRLGETEVPVHPAVPDHDGFADAAPEDELHPHPAHAEDGHAEEAASDDAAPGHPDDSGDPLERTAPDTIGGEGDPAEEARQRREANRLLRNYKIQEVIRRRQILLVQVTKEERGNKGAALTTYISLAGRFCVLMPNSPSGGGVSRKITSAADRRRLKEITAELEIPRGMGIIVRTAGAQRPKPEIKRDCEYLLRLWDDIRDHTMRSVAPSQIYEEASLIKRAIRDVYSATIDEVLVDGEAGWRAAHDFMRQLMPTHAKKVQLAPPDGQPLFARFQADALLDAILEPVVQLRSGGYLVIDQTEALVAIDVNSGRSTRERNIEETALRTNLEAADEVARQLRLRDLAGLIVIDFIDMESRKHNAMVERRLKEALDADRARIQVGHISHFGLMEMSRQRLRPSLAEANFVACAHCNGSGQVRSTESAALYLLRAIEDEAGRHRAAEIMVHVASGAALYLMNHKRARLSEIEARTGMAIRFAFDESLLPGQNRIERVRPLAPGELPVPVGHVAPPLPPAAEPEPADLETEALADAETATAAPVATAESGAETEEGRRRRRRRRRRSGPRTDETEAVMPEGADQPELPPVLAAGSAAAEPVHAGPIDAPAPAEPGPAPAPSAPVETADAAAQTDPGETATAEPAETRGRSRGRRGGRRRRREDEVPAESSLFAGATPADPFGVTVLDLLDPEEPSILTPPPPVETAVQTQAVLPAEPAMPVPVPQEPAPSEPIDAPAPAVNGVPDEAAPAAAPAVQPVLVGVADAPGEKKRGWWRR